MGRRVLAVLLMVMLSTGFASFPRDPDPNVVAPENVVVWFEQSALDEINQVSAQVFPDAAESDLAGYTIGAPRAVFGFSTATSAAETSIVESTYWIAPILSGESAVGAIWASFANDQVQDVNVDNDVRLANEAAASADGQYLIFDSALTAWFIYRDGAVEPGDDAGAMMVLGAVPFDQFIQQRIEFVTGDPVLPEKDSEETLVADNDLRPTVLQISVVLVILFATAVVSLLWLRWDSSRDDDDFLDDIDEEITTPAPRRRGSFRLARVLTRPRSTREDESEALED
ncbi:MAG: hypothetical protein GX483_02000 [Actinomycetaceae bacterium]|nr:hypothetical protein [Actinomycetaceae bacterium]